MLIHDDCRHYRTDRPCGPHKATGTLCDGCRSYDRIDTRILVVKLDATGDVLRTTSILRPLRAAYPSGHITWITKPEAMQVLWPNRYIDQVVPLGIEANLVLETTPFDLVINPDASILSCRIATVARGRDKRGFLLDETGRIRTTNAAAGEWYRMGLSDPAKKRNTRTYQSILLEICGLPELEHPIVWDITPGEASFAGEFAARHAVKRAGGLNIGLNTGAGGRWRWKKWTEEGFATLIEAITGTYPLATVLLYGGPEEAARNAQLAGRFPGRVVDTGTGNSLREFGALVDLCDVMVTGDTMALHLASALGKRVVAIFGPTSAAEIELYGRGEKLVPAGMDCLGCYLNDCDVRPACMERIAMTEVLAAVGRQVERLASRA